MARRFTILAHGSRGDVQPYVALGRGLRQAGHRVRLACPARFEQMVVDNGLEFAPLAGDPTTLARDLRTLVEQGYELGQVEAFDFFPQTYHLESVATLTARK